MKSVTKKQAVLNESDRSMKFVVKRYREPDEYAYVNTNDNNLQKIKIKLPPCPDWRKIDGYGMSPKDQLFRVQDYPLKLKELEKEAKIMIRKRHIHKKSKPSIRSEEKEIEDYIWDILKRETRNYKEEIKWIRKQWSYRIYGYWFFNNGKPTYIDGWHFFYLNYWALEGVGRPDYWDRDRRWFLFQRFCYTDTTIPVRDENGDLVYDDEGFFKTKDIGARTCFGSNVNKGRRVGDTSKAQCINYCFLSSMLEINTGIQGNDGETAEKAFLEKLVIGYRSKYLRFFFKPKSTNTNPKSEMLFDVDVGSDGLRSRGDYATTASRTFYDSRRMTYLHQDEVGKTILEDIDKRQDVLKRCCQEGSNIIGLMIATTTVEDTGHDAIQKFLKLTEKSHYQDRDKNGRTASGLYNLFIPAYDGYKGFIDRYGFSIISSPTRNQIKDMSTIVRNDRGEVMGCKEFLENERKALLDRGDIEGYTSHKRLHPFEFSECFTPPARNQLFNVHKLEKRHNELSFKKNGVNKRVGYFSWASGFGSDVVWNDCEDEDDSIEANKRFNLYKMPDPELRNRKYLSDGVFAPEFHTTYIASADAFRLEKTQGSGSSISNGGGAIRWRRDMEIDPPDKDVKDWVTAKYVCTYNYRPATKDEYAEDMLMMCIFFGAMMYPEMNVPLIYEKFTDWGYGGYLLYDMDKHTGDMKAMPGFHTVSNTKVNLFNYMRDEIEMHGDRWEDRGLIEECLRIKDADDMKNYDLFTAAAGCLLGERSEYAKALSQFRTTNYDVSGFWGI